MAAAFAFCMSAAGLTSNNSIKGTRNGSVMNNNLGSGSAGSARGTLRAIHGGSTGRSAFKVGVKKRTSKAQMTVRAQSGQQTEPTGPKFTKLVPEGDERERDVCESCGFVDYRNPKVVVGAVSTWEGRVLLCRRGIEPRVGKWGFPQGFMELGESTREGAARETVEEAGAKIETGALLAVYNLPGQVQMLYLAELVDGAISAGAESLEVKLFAWDELPPSEELAFPTVEWALEYAAEVLKGGADAGGAVVPQQRTKLIFDNSSGFAEETELQQM